MVQNVYCYIPYDFVNIFFQFCIFVFILFYWTAESRLTGAHNRWLQRDGRSFSFHASVRPSVPLYWVNLPQFLTYELEILHVGSNYVSLVIVYVFVKIKTFFEFFSYIVKFQVCSNALFDSSFLSSRQVQLKTP